MRGAEVPGEDLKRPLPGGGAGHDERVVVAGEGDDRARVVPERIVELVVIIFRLAEIIDHVAEVEQEGRPLVGGVGREVPDHAVGDGQLMVVVGRVARPGVPDRMERDLPGGGDLPRDLRSGGAERVRQGVVVGRVPAGNGDGRGLGREQFRQPGVDGVVRRVRGVKAERIGQEFPVLENRLVENGGGQLGIGIGPGRDGVGGRVGRHGGESRAPVGAVQTGRRGDGRAGARAGSPGGGGGRTGHIFPATVKVLARRTVTCWTRQIPLHPPPPTARPQRTFW